MNKRQKKKKITRMKERIPNIPITVWESVTFSTYNPYPPKARIFIKD